MTDNKTCTTINPNVFQAILLDGIDQKLKESINIQNITSNLLKSLIELQANSVTILDKINSEQKQDADKGEFYKINDTASLTMKITNLIQLFGHGVKTYKIKNEGSNSIYVGHTTIKMELHTTHDTDNEIKPTEEFGIQYNREVINTISYITRSGTSDFRLWVTW